MQINELTDTLKKLIQSNSVGIIKTQDQREAVAYTNFDGDHREKIGKSITHHVLEKAIYNNSDIILEEAKRLVIDAIEEECGENN